MIDVNDLDGLLELANDYVDDGLHFLTEPVSYGGLLILVERIIAAEKDAARYRWLRDNSVDLDWVVYGEEKTHVDITVWHNDGFDSANNGVDATQEEIDALIDEAMQCSK